MNLDEAIAALRERHEPTPQPVRLPTVGEVDDAQRRLGVQFHPDFRRYLLEASDVCCGVLEPVTITQPNAHDNLFAVANEAWNVMDVPHDLLPICEDNGDYYCMNAKGEMVFWSHDGASSEKWKNVADWIEMVWLEGEFDDDEDDD